MDDSVDKVAIEIVRLQNIRLHASRVKVPMPNNWKRQRVSDDPHEIFFYTNPPFKLRLFGDGVIYTIQKGETFDDRMQKVIANTKRSIADQDSLHNTDPDKCLLPYKELTNPQGIQFKTFVQDIIYIKDGLKRFIRSTVA